MWLFLGVPWVGLQCVIVLFPDHNHLILVAMIMKIVDSIALFEHIKSFKQMYIDLIIMKRVIEF